MRDARSPSITHSDGEPVSDGDDLSDSDLEFEGSTHQRYFRWACLAIVVATAAIVGYAVAKRDDGLESLGPWTKVETHDRSGITVTVQPSLKTDSTTPAPGVATPAPPANCNRSVPVIQDWGVRGPFELDDYWEKKCHDESTMPPDTWNWPGRNWCWVRTKTRSCYPHDGEKTVPNWYWAQKRVADDGFAPDPDKELLEAYVHPELCDIPELGEIWLDTPKAQREASTAWIKQNIAIYVVNLPTSVDRWHKMEYRFSQLGLEAHRIPGVDLRPEGALERAQKEDVVPTDYDYDKAMQKAHELFSKSDNGGILKVVDELGVGTVGCAAAHLRAQRLAHSFATEAGKPMALIMEDDVYLSDDFAPKLHYIIENELPCNWEVYAITTRCGYGECVAPHVSRVQPDGNEPEERCHNSGSYGMYGQLYRTDSMLKVNDLLKGVCFNDEKPACLPVDTALASISDRVAYYAAPGSQQPGLATEASWGGSNRADMNQQTLDGADAQQMDHALHRKSGESGESGK